MNIPPKHFILNPDVSGSLIMIYQGHIQSSAAEQQTVTISRHLHNQIYVPLHCCRSDNFLTPLNPTTPCIHVHTINTIYINGILVLVHANKVWNGYRIVHFRKRQKITLLSYSLCRHRNAGMQETVSAENRM